MSQPKLIRRLLGPRRRSTQPPLTHHPWGAVTLAGLVLLLGGCTATGGLPTAAGAPGSGATSTTSADRPGPVQTARVGRPADSTRIRFVPEQLVLPGDARAAVVPAQTVGGQLQVPSDVRHLGWWDGSSEAGDPFGSTVIAGHVDSATSSPDCCGPSWGSR
jgi:hypothetical protein